eukprot:c21903_g2_i1.p1 GENE.c21903_g2_i1~~c21903_g2_i1.p1  ORF type:complete len:963 (+),score=436.86 c21903_g2_i1:56-2944(+)
MRVLAFFLLIASALCLPTLPENNLQHSDSKYKDNVLYVHLIPHSHDDVGWLKTVDQYYAGLQEGIQQASVKSIISSVVDALAKNPDRKFVQVETAFFTRWWNEQTSEVQSQVHSLVQNGQIEFINGGLCMHDEATTHFQSMIDQTTEGHLFLNDTFGVAPRAQWQIDPFGHSSANADLSAQMGMKSLFFARMDYADFAERNKNQALEFQWYPSKSNPSNSIFTQVFINHYGAPDGFSFNVDSNDDPFQDNPALEDFNAESIANRFINWARSKAPLFRTNHILQTMGDDFNYRQADEYYRNMDKLIYYTNLYSNGSVQVLYSTPSIYTDIVTKLNNNWPTKTDDFFPYGDSPNAYWTGYFTSRPGLKRYERTSMNFLQACKQIETQSSITGASTALKQAMGVAQHHDAVSGTEKQAVAFDYAQRISGGINQCADMMGKTIASAAGISSTLNICPLLNDSVCQYTVGSRSDKIKLVIYNTLASSRTEIVQIPVTSAKGASIKDANGNFITTQVVQNSDITISLGNLEAQRSDTTGQYSLYFRVQLPALGYATYTVDFSGSATHPFTSESIVKNFQGSISNNYITLNFDSTSGQLLSYLPAGYKTPLPISQGFYEYFSSPGNAISSQPSGAYIFRPAQNSADPCSLSTQLVSVIQGPLVQEVRQIIRKDISQVVRLFVDEQFAEFEWTVGPVDTTSGHGKEIITRYTSMIESDEEFYTDSNSRDMIYRKRNFRQTWTLNITEPVSQNYYPVTSSAYLNDTNTRLTVVTDRAQGVSSLNDGELEFMVHRRTLKDDNRGVGEPIADPGVDGKGYIARGRHWLILSTGEAAPYLHKNSVQRLTYEPLLMFSGSVTSKEEEKETSKASFSNMLINFPDNVQLLTKQLLSPNNYLVRVNHIYEVGEDASLSQPATVSLADVFPNHTISNIVELSLSANRVLTDSTFRFSGKDSNVVLNPMQIRTFKVTVA